MRYRSISFYKECGDGGSYVPTEAVDYIEVDLDLDEQDVTSEESKATRITDCLQADSTLYINFENANSQGLPNTSQISLF